MSNTSTAKDNSAKDILIESRHQLIDLLAQGCKPNTDWRIGTEHEKFGFIRPEASQTLAAYTPPPYFGPHGIEALLSALYKAQPHYWTPIFDEGNIIGLNGQGDQAGASISLEPAGQFELSGAPLRTLHATAQELHEHFNTLRPIARTLGIGFAPLGFHPTATRAAMPWIPNSRYALMRSDLPQVGSLGIDMMQRTCTVQVNLDFSSEQDMVRKMQVSTALQPVAMALFANSPFFEGKPNGFLSNRIRVWGDTDSARSGIHPYVFLPDLSFECYVDWVLDVPMYFIIRNGHMRNVAGRSFRAWLNGEHQEELEDTRPTLEDFNNHLTTVFPDVRLKQFLEIRGADVGSPEMILALSALWAGLLYDTTALDSAWDLVRSYPWEDYLLTYKQVPTQGLNAPFGKGTLRALADQVVHLALNGLQNRAIIDQKSQMSEEMYLAPLLALVEGAPTQAEHWLNRYHGAWMGDTDRIFLESEV